MNKNISKYELQKNIIREFYFDATPFDLHSAPTLHDLANLIISKGFSLQPEMVAALKQLEDGGKIKPLLGPIFCDGGYMPFNIIQVKNTKLCLLHVRDIFEISKMEFTSVNSMYKAAAKLYDNLIPNYWMSVADIANVLNRIDFGQDFAPSVVRKICIDLKLPIFSGNYASYAKFDVSPIKDKIKIEKIKQIVKFYE